MYTYRCKLFLIICYYVIVDVLCFYYLALFNYINYFVTVLLYYRFYFIIYSLFATTLQMESRKKVARLVLSFVVVFVVCWLPRHVWYFWFNFDPAEYNMFWHVFKIVAYCLSFVNSCVNPLALYFLSRQFRRYYDRYLFCCCRHPPAADPRGAALLATGPQRAGRSPALGPDTTATTRPHERMQMTVVDVGPAAGRRQQPAAAAADQPRARTKSTMITVANTTC